MSAIDRTWKRKLDAAAVACRNAAALQSTEPVACDTCHGTGQVCVGTSGLESDGNAPVMERCPECGYAAPQAGAVAAPTAEDARDARRYRWLKVAKQHSLAKLLGLNAWCANGSDHDAAIDAALAADTNPKEPAP